MSWFDYKQSIQIGIEGYPFYALIMAAMRDADTDNIEILKAGWPHVWKELSDRYHAPDGFLTEKEMEKFG